jgi:23S rRNA pseudouridine1911/1915/1917 synthase
VSAGRPALVRAVAPGEAGRRLDALLACWQGTSRAQAQARIAAGAVRVDGGPAAQSLRVRAGQRVTVAAAAEPPAPAAPPPVPVRYEDEHLLVVAKPAGLVVHAGAGVADGTLVDALQAMGVRLAPGPDPQRPGVVHRLDRGTSGLLLIAKTESARRGLIALLKRRAVERRYWALVDGVPDPPVATVDAPIARSQRQRTRFTVADDGRPARTSYELVEAFGRCAVLRVRLATGRTHQVRVHLSALGHPVSGDRTYGADPALAASLGLRRPALHAEHLAFDHPVSGTRIAVDEPLPADLVAARAALER